jgi:hypothetical protein
VHVNPDWGFDEEALAPLLEKDGYLLHKVETATALTKEEL